MTQAQEYAAEYTAMPDPAECDDSDITVAFEGDEYVATFADGSKLTANDL